MTTAAGGAEPAPIIVSALFGDEDFCWLDGQRQRWFPPDRNIIPAHLTLFHHLPPSTERELLRSLREECSEAAPQARVAGLLSLGRGVAYRIDSAGLDECRERLRQRFSGLLTPQDAGGWRAHVTVQNKVDPLTAKALKAELEQGFKQRPVSIAGLAAWWYRGGPWELIAAFRFGTGHPMRAPHMPVDRNPHPR